MCAVDDSNEALLDVNNTSLFPDAICQVPQTAQHTLRVASLFYDI